MKKVLLLLLSGVVISGCARIGDPINKQQSKEDETTSRHCASNESEYDYSAKGDEITSWRMVTMISLEDFALPEETERRELESAIRQSVQDLYKEVRGVSASCTFTETDVVVSLVVNLEAANLDDLIEFGLLQKADVVNQYVSLSRTTEALEQAGYVCDGADQSES